MGVEDVVVVESSPMKKVKYCIIGVPDAGLVGVIAASYIISSLKMTETGHLESDMFPPVMVVHDGNPKPPFRVYNKEDVTIITSEIPISPETLFQTARCIVDWIKSKNVELLISITGIAVPNRLEIDAPTVYGVGNQPSVRELFSKADVQPFEEGFMAGLHALVVKECSKEKIPNLILLAQSHYQYPDPAAAVSVINSLSKLLGLEIDTKELLAQAEEIRLRSRELMQRTQRSMQGMQKEQEQEMPMMYV